MCRFCTEKYSLSSKNLKNRFGHLTNYSVNKRNEKFDKNTDPDADGEGSKWSLQALLRWFEMNGIDGNKVLFVFSDFSRSSVWLRVPKFWTHRTKFYCFCD